MKKLFICLFFFPVLLNAQGWTFQYELGYGSFQMKDIKAIQDRIADAMSMYGAQSTEYFPNHYIQSAAIGYNFGRHHLGINGAFLTTGGRVNVGDYSGNYTTDIVLSGYRLGAFYRHYIPSKTQWFNVYAQITPGVLFSNLKMNEELVIGNQKLIEENLKYKSIGAYIEPSVGILFKPLKWLHLSLSGGYEFDIWGRMKLTDNTQIKYQDYDKISWNGFRIYAGFMFVIPNKR